MQLDATTLATQRNEKHVTRPLVREFGFRNVGKGFDCGIRNPRKFVLLGSRILIFEFRNTTQGIRDPINDWNPESRFHWPMLELPFLESGIHSLESRIQECIGPYMGRSMHKIQMICDVTFEPVKLVTSRTGVLKPFILSNFLKNLILFKTQFF